MRHCLLPICVLLCASTRPLFAEPLALQEPVALPDQSVARDATAHVSVPPMPIREGLVTVLSFRAVIVTEGPGGCNYNLAVEINGEPLRQQSSDGTKRLLGRSGALELVAGGESYPIFSDKRIMIMFAADAGQGDGMTSDGHGATFSFDVTDMMRGVDGNTFSFHNPTPGKWEEGFGHLQVTDLTVGWLDRSTLPKPPSLAPVRQPLTGGVSVGRLKLAQSSRGGFVFTCDDTELIVETALSVQHDAPPVLLADDTADQQPVQLQSGTLDDEGFTLTATWPGLLLERTLLISDGLLVWHEKWSNTSSDARGVPFRHRFYYRQPGTQFRIGGATDITSALSSAPNPTLYMEQPGTPSTAFGVTAEDDWLRLLTGWRATSDLGEMYTRWLALAPGDDIEFDITITPVSGHGGYWDFISSLRNRWNVNGVTLDTPLFWYYDQANEQDVREAIRKGLEHLGPVTVIIPPWQRVDADASFVRTGRYPRLPDEAPRVRGLCPDFDVDAFLTFQHREAFRQSVADHARLLHENVPGVRVIQMLHPAMDVVYRPLQERWPIAPDAIKMAAGSTFEDLHYTRELLENMADRDWGVLYYCPHENGPQLAAVLDGIIRSMDECGLDGVYVDEFSWANRDRGYSRYDYSQWDGYSADLDKEGNPVRFKTDNAMASKASQLQIIEQVLQRDKFFLGNGGNALEALNQLPIHRFVEGGNAPSYYGLGHLSSVPLILGNMGDRTTTQGVFESVKLCLQHGSIYSPVRVNLLLEGSDNFVCKQYPITIERLGPGWVIGKERLITTVNRTFDWPAEGGTVRIYRYDHEGTRIDADAEVTVPSGEQLTPLVPEGGLAIAEKI